MIHHLENFLASAKRAHNLQKFDKNPGTITIVNFKTRPPPICPGKKVIGHPCQKIRRQYKNVSRSILLKNSPHMELVLVEKITCKKEDCLL